MGVIISLILIGLILLLAEILIVPGVGFAGILGVMAMGGSCYYAFYEFGSLAGGLVSAVNAVLLIVALVYVLRAKTWKRMALETNIDSKAVEDKSSLVSVGDIGKAETRLAPMGSVRFGKKILEAKSSEGVIDPGSEVEVVYIEDNKIIVSLKH